MVSAPTGKSRSGCRAGWRPPRRWSRRRQAPDDGHAPLVRRPGDDLAPDEVARACPARRRTAVRRPRRSPSPESPPPPPGAGPRSARRAYTFGRRRRSGLASWTRTGSVCRSGSPTDDTISTRAGERDPGQRRAGHLGGRRRRECRATGFRRRRRSPTPTTDRRRPSAAARRAGPAGSRPRSCRRRRRRAAPSRPAPVRWWARRGRMRASPSASCSATSRS